ncbi:MAG: hypothetical protein HY901_19205 [Deltaproteobacteria bacterium]|nr:hypothetical protein [Deltaproteobacteria bacterium]
MRQPLSPFVMVAAWGLALAWGCGEPGGLGPDAGGKGSSADSGMSGLDVDDIVIQPGVDTGPTVGRDGGSTPSGVLIWAHTDNALFRGDPSTQPLQLTRVGSFDCIGDGGTSSSMTDLAVNMNGQLFGVSAAAVYPLEIRGSSVHCAETWRLQSSGRFYGMTFAPAGVLGPEEMLVGANSAGELWAIDAQGSATQVGTFGQVPADDGHGHVYANAGKDWELSGDIVFLSNDGDPVGFATLRDCPNPPSTTGCNRVDTLVEIDVTKLALGNTASVTKSVRGQVVKGAGCNDPSTATGYGSTYGIAAWNDKVFGFSRKSGDGYLIEIDNQDGTACLVQRYPDDAFAGAGVSTLAPVQGPN